MRIPMTTTVLLAAALAAVASAGPLKTEWVAADAKWVVHLDVDALTASTIGKAILEEGDRLDIDLHELDEFARETGLDPRTDVMSMTAYGAGGDFDGDGVAVFVTNTRADEALQRLLDAEEMNAVRIQLDGRDVVRFGDGHEDFYVHVRPGPRRDERLVVFARHGHLLVGALEVIEALAPSLSMGRGTVFPVRPGRDSILFVAADGLDGLGDIEPASEILRLSEGLAVDVGETNGELAASATVSARDDQTARQITQVVQGMIALGQLAAGQEPDLEPLRALCRAISVDTRERLITVRFHYDSQRLLNDLQEMDD